MAFSISELKKYEDELISLRRDFHKHPELGFEEFRTSGVVKDYLESLGITTRRMAKTGVLGELKNGNDKVIAIRADMDALPIQEENAIPYRSEVAGIMHACGHDAHTAMLLITAKILSQTNFDGSVRFIFQPAEEGLNGASKMVEEGAIDKVSSIFAVHVWADLPSKTLAISPGPVLASVDQFKIRVEGKGGHGASPHQTADPIVTSAHIIAGMQSIVGRNVDPLKPAVVTVGKINGGTAFNIIPEYVDIEGTVRTFDEDVHKLIEKRVKEIAKRMAESFNCTAEVDYRCINHATVNDKELAEIGRSVASKITDVVEQPPNMGGEDFSEYARRVPGLFAFLGVRNEKLGIVYPHHSPKFNIDESALIYGVAFEVNMALKLLGAEAYSQ